MALTRQLASGSEPPSTNWCSPEALPRENASRRQPPPACLPVVLELGGKDPMLVLDDADIEVASSAAVWGAFMNAGQACLSVERCYVHRSLYQPFLEACVRKTRQLRVGNGMDPETDVGPMIHERQLLNVRIAGRGCPRSAERAYSTGAKRLPELGPNFYAPTVLADCHAAMRIMREETFGPVLPVMPFDIDDEAVRLANDSEYGLAASVWTRDRGRGEAVARRIQAGTVMVNDLISCFGISEAPHGGSKASGIGRSHGRFGLEEMVRTKYLDSDRLPGMEKVWWYGYGNGVYAPDGSSARYAVRAGIGTAAEGRNQGGGRVQAETASAILTEEDYSSGTWGSGSV